IALLLAMLLCLVPALASCGVNSSPEKVVEAVVEATYKDFDYEVFNKVCYNLDVGLYEDVLEGDDLKDAKENIRSIQDVIKEGFKETQKEAEKFKDYDLKYDIRYCEIYDEKDDEFDKIIKANSSINDTDFEDLTDKVAKVRVVGEIFITDEDGEDDIEEIDNTFTCYHIDGKWYIDFNS
ncbi:MAG: hypothetical protein IJC20_02065, partial [Clostridia bacterium]|nr:hypothetical protein [Clostridia bacterium]